MGSAEQYQEKKATTFSSRNLVNLSQYNCQTKPWPVTRCDATRMWSNDFNKKRNNKVQHSGTNSQIKRAYKQHKDVK